MKKQYEVVLKAMEIFDNRDNYAYLYGADGQIGSDALVDQMVATYQSHFADKDVTVIKNDVRGKICYDCSGFVHTVFDAPDMTSKVIIDDCTIIDISESIPGAVLWKPGHVGIAVFDGYCVDIPTEETTFRMRKVSDCDWTMAGKWEKYAEYTQEGEDMAQLFRKEMTNEEFIKAWGEKAVSRYSESKVLPSLPICQAILESGWGTSGIAITLGNYHGMNYYGDSVTKGYSYATRTTQQERNGQLVDSVEQFCRFDTIDEELDCLYKWYNRDNAAYKELHGCTDAIKNFELIKEAGYATSSAYTESLTRIYNQYPLIKTYDDQVLTPVPTTKHLYYVQVGAFKNRNYAENYMKRIKASGFDAFVKEIDGWYKIQVGAYEVKKNAEVQLAKVKTAGYQAFIAEGDVTI